MGRHRMQPLSRARGAPLTGKVDIRLRPRDGPVLQDDAHAGGEKTDVVCGMLDSKYSSGTYRAKQFVFLQGEVTLGHGDETDQTVVRNLCVGFPAVGRHQSAMMTAFKLDGVFPRHERLPVPTVRCRRLARRGSVAYTRFGLPCAMTPASLSPAFGSARPAQ